MKKLLFYLMFITGSVTGFSQSFPCDPTTNGLSVSPTTIAVGQTADFSFVVYNGGSSVGCSIPALDFEVIVSLPFVPAPPFNVPNYYAFQSFVTPSTGTYFDWVYDASDNTIKGYNRVAVPNLGFESVTFRVVGQNNTASGGASSNINISDIGGGPDNIGNNTGSTPLIVTTLVSVSLSDITAVSTDCSAKLNWKTTQEDAGTSFDVEYSPDGRYYVKVGTIAGRGITGSAYEYAYNQGNGIGFYRLKINKPNGASSYSSIVSANVKCGARKVFIYPNPVKSDAVLNVNVSGYADKIKGELFSAEGKFILTHQLQNGANSIKMNNLPEGSYLFKVYDGAKAVQNYKVVVVK